MPLPDGEVTVNGGDNELKTGMTMKIPHDLWLLFEKAAKDSNGRFKVSLEDGFRLVQPNGEIVSLGVHTTGVPSEIHSVDAIRAALQPVALASARLSVPIAAPKSKTQGKGDKVVKPAPLAKPSLPAKAVASLANVTSMSRTQSTPVGAGTTSTTAAAPAAATASSPKVPLKTRVIQLLASGDYDAEDIAKKVDAPMADAMRVVNVLGRAAPGHPVKFGLRPAEYAKVKFTDWPYTRLERKSVIERSRRAFDGLGLAYDSEEYVELERKIKESTPVDTSPSGSSCKSGLNVRDLPKIKKLTPEQKAEQAAAAAKFGGSAQFPLLPPVPTTTKSTNGKAKKSLIGKEREKHRAEKRSSSHPLPPKAAATQSGKADKKPVKSGMSREKAYYTSSSSSEDEKPTKKLAHKRKSSTPPIKTPAHVNVPAVKTHVPAAVASTKRSNPSDDDVSPPKRFKHLPDRPLEDCPEMIPDEDPLRAEPLQRQRTSTLSRSQSTDAEAVRGHWSNASSPNPRSPQELRERYDELYPAYVLLTEKLRSAMKIVQDVDNLPEVIPVGEEEVGEMLAKFNRWHAELEKIRIAFRDCSP